MAEPQETEAKPLEPAENTDHGRRVIAAEEAVRAVFSDTSVSQQQTRESLEGIQQLIREQLEALDE